MSQVNSVKALRAKRSKRLSRKRGLPLTKGSLFSRPWTTGASFLNSLHFCVIPYFNTTHTFAAVFIFV